MYRIKSYTKRQARKLGVTKVASVGAIGYDDYPTHTIKRGKKYADERRRLYKIRHKKDRSVRGSAGYYADRLLW